MFHIWPIKLQGSLISRRKWVTKFIFGVQINIEVFCKLILSFWVCVARHAQSTQNKKFAYLCNISRKTWEMRLIFCQQINTKFFYKLIVLLCVCLARHALSNQNNKFANLCNISWKTWRMKLIFCLQMKVSSDWYYHLRCVWSGMHKLTQIIFFNNIWRKKWVLKVFCLEICLKCDGIGNWS